MKMTQIDGSKFPHNWKRLYRVIYCLWCSVFAAVLLMGDAYAVNSLATPAAASGVSFVSPAVAGAQYINGFDIAVKVTSPDVVKVKLTADGFAFGSELNAANSWTINYTFSTLGLRNLVATGYNINGGVVSTTNTSINVVNLKILDPAKNASYSNGTPASVAASAVIKKVIMFADTYQIGSATIRDGSGNFVITPAYLNTLGLRTFKFQGFDGAGVKVDESSVPVKVVELSFISPANGATFKVNDVVNVQVNAAGNVARVDYYGANSYFWGSSTNRASLFKISTPLTVTGARVLYAKSYSAAGVLLSTDSVNFSVIVPDNNTANKWGVWLFEFESVAQMATTHEQLAAKLKSMGVNRIYIKVADGSLATWPTKNGPAFPLNDARVPAAYKAQGIEPYAWAYNYPHANPSGRSDATLQGNVLYAAAKSGYVGFVSDVEEEFNNATTERQVAVFRAFVSARQRAIADGFATSTFKLYESSFGRIDFKTGIAFKEIDAYVDGHMPQTYTVFYGASAEADQVGQIAKITQLYKNVGVVKPIHHITSIERHFSASTGLHELTVPRLQTFLENAGNEASVWTLPASGDGTGEQDVPFSSWKLLTGINWLSHSK